MKKAASIALSLIFVLLFSNCKNSQQTRIVETGDRLSDAYTEKSEFLVSLLAQQQLAFDEYEVLIRAFKEEQILEVWTRKKGTQPYAFLVSYPFCTSSGVLGPKRKEGDRQIPEGIYRIDRFNPHSDYYLSLGLNYPNRADILLGDPAAPGTDIFIHGDCLTIGCIPITNDKIKEVYVLADQAKRNGQSTIYAHLFPARLTTDKYKELTKSYPQHRALWKSLHQVYRKFEATKVIPYVHINDQGLYEVRE